MIVKKKTPKFQRTQSHQYSKLGRGRKKKQKYRHARGLDNKMRLKHKGKPVRVMIGFRSDKRIRSLIDGKKIVSVSNIQELKNVKKNEIALISKIGRKKKMELMKYAIDNKIQLHSVNPKKSLEEIENKIRIQKEEKKIRQNKKRLNERKGKKESKKEEKEEKINNENNTNINKESGENKNESG